MTRRELEALKSLTMYHRSKCAYDPMIEEDIVILEKLVIRTIEENKIIEGLNK